MAFLRYAYARSVSPHLSGQNWDNVRVAAAQPRMDRNLVDQASTILKEEFNPANYLLSHATLVASVDTVDVPNARVGASTYQGKRVNRKTTAYRIKPECEKFINNNYDSWERGVLLKSYRTLVGAHNFLEHIQVENLSKGRILDAVPRDIGDSVYVDILVATHRKHRELIADIESGRLTTLSMGCSIDGSTCTQCGHWAADETEFCDHIKYQKGDTFYDERGNRCRIAELCGDISLEPTGGVTFVEGSWVGTPAFGGAVRRNFLTLSPGEMDRVAQNANRVFSFPAPPISSGDFRKAASLIAGGMDFGEEPEAPKAPPAPKDPMKDLTEEVKKTILDRAMSSIREDMERDNIQKAVAPSDAPNNTLVKQARANRARYIAGVSRIVRTASGDRDLIVKIAQHNCAWSIFLPGSLYQTALKVGSSDKYGSLPSFLGKCKEHLGRTPTVSEARALIRLAKLLTTRRVGMKPKK